jgi:hypothetical protein
MGKSPSTLHSEFPTLVFAFQVWAQDTKNFISLPEETNVFNSIVSELFALSAVEGRKGVPYKAHPRSESTNTCWHGTYFSY